MIDKEETVEIEIEITPDIQAMLDKIFEKILRLGLEAYKKGERDV